MTAQDSLPVTAEPGEPADADLGDGWVCPPCRRGRCDRCTDRDCRCCSGAPDDPA